MSSSKEKDLELECHYLSQALSKLKPNSSEWSFLQQKLEVAEEELDMMRAYPPPPPQQHPSPYLDDSGKIYNTATTSGTYRDKDPYTNNIPYVDDPDEYHDDRYNTSSSATIDNDRSALYPSSPNNSMPSTRPCSHVASPSICTNMRKRLLASILFVIAVAILIIFPLLMTKRDGSSNSLAMDKDDELESPIVITEPCASFSFHMIPDQFGNETSWMIVKYNDAETSEGVEQNEEIPVKKGGPYSYTKAFDNESAGDHYEMVHATTCLQVGKYAFILYDAKGDGICCQYGRGEYGINISKGKTIRPLSPGDFVGTEEITSFTVSEDDIDVIPEIPSLPDNIISDSGDDDESDLPLDGVFDTIAGEDPITTPCASWSMHLIPDQFGNETSWKIMRFDGVGMATLRTSYDPSLGLVVLDGGPYKYKKQFDYEAIGSHYEIIEATACLPVGMYTFTLYDAKGDGICCNYGRGEYGINLSKGRVIRPLSQGVFKGAGQVTPFQVTTDDIDVLPPPSAATVSSSSDTANIVDDSTTPSDTSLSSSSSSNCASWSLHLVPDQFGNETSWKLFEYKDGEHDRERSVEAVIESNKKRQLRDTTIIYSRNEKEKPRLVLSGGPYSYKDNFDKEEASGSYYNDIIAETCLPVGSYKFVLFDAEEDGICCEYGNGEYGINLSKGRVIRPLSQGLFTESSEETSFDVTAEDLPPVLSAPYSPSNESSPPNESSQPESNPNADSISTLDLPHVAPSPTNHGHTTTTSTTSISSLQSLVTVEGDEMSDSRGKSYGILFDVEINHSVSSLTISGMDLYLDTNALTHYEIWSKIGSWQDVNNNSNPDYFEGFARVSHGSVTGKGSLEFTRIALGDFHDIPLQGGQRQAFYITLSDDNLVFTNYEGEGISRHELSPGLKQKSTDKINVFYGAAVRAYPLEKADPLTDFWYNSGFLGRLWYKEGT